MLLDTIEREFREKVSSEVELMAEGSNRYQVFTPFRFDDGDHLSIVLKQHYGDRWVLSDEANTYMRLTYEIDEKDFGRGNRKKIIDNALSVFQIEDYEGELLIEVGDGQYGDALYSFIQALLKITDITYLSRERVHTTFRDDFRTLCEERVPEDRLTFDWYHPQFDPNELYKVDCYVNGTSRPLVVYALDGNRATRDATVALLKFEAWKWDIHSLAIFEDQGKISGNVLARFSDVCERQFSNLTGNRDRITRYLDEILSVESRG